MARDSAPNGPASLVPVAPTGPTSPSPNASRYRLIFELGRGGMADVVLAVIEGPGGFHKLQVLKFLRDELAGDPDYCTMFLDEAKLSARLNHPNIAQTNEVGFDGKRYFFAMEYLEGHSLDELLRRIPENKRPLPIMLRIVADACAGLHFAHEHNDFDGTPLNVIHRDVSPQNIFVTYDGAIKLLDFGIAKANDSKSRTEAGTIKGKIAYMAPEQIVVPDRIDRRADIFSVGAILWRLISGKRLWSGVTEMEVLQRLAGREIPLPTPLPGTPEELVRICRKAMAPHVQDRYATAAELHADLQALLTSLGGATYTDVAALVSHLFAARRKEVRAAIEAQLFATASQTNPRFTQLTQIPRLETASGIVEMEHAKSASTLTAHVPAARTNWGIAGAGIVIAIGVVVAAFVARSPAAPPQSATTSPPSAAAVDSVQKPEQKAEPKAETEVTFDVSPSQAQVFLDDTLLPRVPGSVQGKLHGTFPQDGRDHSVRVEADGFASKTLSVSFRAASVHVEVSLERERRSSPQWRPAAKTRAASPTTASPSVPAAPSAAPPPTAAPTAPAPTSRPAATALPNQQKALDKEDPWKR
ncbi:serine/threonine protein kinase [Pendulispora rubella]|uniref:Serine/threonine protein kinase n=1 Tax=Pendulispora rubella TaxID=2741070 RepID=A0ABZ2L905_9BACT